jgi:tetratricopeptide (TPR) repeat protein
LTAVAKLESLGATEQIGMACVEFAQLYFRKGDSEKALEFCLKTSSLLPEQHLYQAKVNRIRGRIAEALGEREDAKNRLQMAADEFKRLEEVTEWDETMFELARLYQQENDMGRTVDVLEEMRLFTKQILSQRGIVL